MYDVYYAWLGQSLYLHQGSETIDVAKGLLFNYMATLGFPVEDFIANDTSAEDAYRAAWKYVPYEDAGFFHYELFMDERYSFCQWSADWSIENQTPSPYLCLVILMPVYIRGLS